MDTKQLPTWKECAAVPINFYYRFIIVNDINSSCLAISEHQGLFRYDFGTNRWDEYNVINQLPDKQGIFAWDMSAAINTNNKTLYFLNGSGEMAQFQINNNQNMKWNIIKDLADTGKGFQCVIIKDKLHVIGGWENNKHLRYNSEMNRFDDIYTLHDILKGIYCHQIVSFNNNIFMFGGLETKNKNLLDTIYHYEIDKNIWNKLSIKMPKPLYSFGCTAAINNKYILIFGGVNNGDHDDIYIFSVSNATFTKSKVKCPETGTFQAITINDKISDEMAVFGYVREQWVLSQLDDHYFPPVYLLKMINMYYFTEFIHLFDSMKGKHWKMSTLHIVS